MKYLTTIYLLVCISIFTNACGKSPETATTGVTAPLSNTVLATAPTASPVTFLTPPSTSNQNTSNPYMNPYMTPYTNPYLNPSLSPFLNPGSGRAPGTPAPVSQPQTQPSSTTPPAPQETTAYTASFLAQNIFCSSYVESGTNHCVDLFKSAADSQDCTTIANELAPSMATTSSTPCDTAAGNFKYYETTSAQ